MIVVRKCTLAEAQGNANFPALAREYAAESAIAGLPPPDEKIAAYHAIEASGIFHIFGAFLGETLVGFVAVLLPVIPHYGIAVGMTESFFVASEHRKSGAGIKLLRAAERLAHDAGSPALMVSAPFGGRLAEVLPGLGYRETNRVFMRELAHG